MSGMEGRICKGRGGKVRSRRGGEGVKGRSLVGGCGRDGVSL